MHHANVANIILKTAIIVICLLNCLNLSYAQSSRLVPLDTNIRIDKMALKAFSALNKSYKTNYEILKTTGLTKININSQIEINMPDILERSKSLDSIQLSWIVTLTVTHEFFHLLQLKRYQYPKTGYQVKIFEAQADLLSGVYMTSRILNEKRNPNFRGDFVKNETFHNAYVMFFNIGTNTFAKANHPSKEQRTTAITRGVLYGSSINLFNRIFNNIWQKNPNDTTINFLKRVIRRNLKVLNINKPDSVVKPSTCGCYDSLLTFNELMDWSYDHAKLIVHGNPKNLANIIVTKSVIDNFKHYPNATIKSTFKNIGEDTLLFAFETRSGRGSNDTLADFEDQYFFDRNFYHKVILKPKKSVTVSDTFLVTKKSSNSIILPPSNYSLFYCNTTNEYADENNRVTASLNLKEPIFREISLLSYIELLGDALRRQDYSRVVATMGASKYEFIRNNKEYIYNGTVPLNSSYECFIERNIKDERKTTITVQLERLSNYPAALSVYDRYSKELEEEYGKAIKEMNYKTFINDDTKDTLLKNKGKDSLNSSYVMNRSKVYNSPTCIITIDLVTYLTDRYHGSIAMKELIYHVSIFLKQKNKTNK